MTRLRTAALGLLLSAGAVPAQDLGPALRSQVAATVNIVVPPGDYRLDTGVPAAPGHIWELTGTRFSGPGVIADSGDWSPFLARLAKGWIKNDAEPGNAFGTVTAVTVGVTGATLSYEKAAGYDYITTADPSTYTGTGAATADLVDKDAVGRQMTATILPGNMTGRVWGLTAVGQVSRGADGAAAAAEFDVVNEGSDQPDVARPNSKTGIGIVATGSVASTVALIVVPGGAHFHDGILIRQDAVSDWAFRVAGVGGAADPFLVSPRGDVRAASLAIGGHVAAGGRAPSASAGEVVAGSSDTRGSLRLPAGVTQATVRFADAFGSPPFCVAGASVFGGVALREAAADAVTVALPANPGGATITWHCLE